MKHFQLVEKLHTDILEERYGKISSKVLKHNSEIREALLIDVKGIARTYAITFLEDFKDKEIKKINEEIKKGCPIGIAFRKKHYVIRKNVLDVFKIKIPLWLKKEFKTKEYYAKGRLSEFYVKKRGKKPTIYGVVAEIYSPDFRKAIIRTIDKLQISALTNCLEKKGFTKESIWRRIGDENNYEDFKNLFEKAKKASKKQTKTLKKKIKEEIVSPR